MSSKWAVLALGLLGVSCGRINYDGLWDKVLVVSTLEDRLAGDDTLASQADLTPGTEGLSLREAVTIANNSPAHDLITFDSRLFRPAIGSTIVLESTLPWLVGAGTAIDARGGNVTLVADFGTQAIKIDTNDVLLRNIKFSGSSDYGLVEIVGGERIQIEGNTFSTDGSALIAANVTDLKLLDNSVVDAGDDGFRVGTSNGVTIEGNSMTGLLGRGMIITETNEVRVHQNKLLHVAGDQIVIRDGVDIDVAFNEIIIDNKTTQKGVQFTRVDGSRICDNFIDPGEARLISLEDSSDNLIEGNILDRGDAGVALSGTSSGNMVFRNIIIGSAYDGIYVASTALGNTIVHNTIHGANSPLVIGDANAQVVGNNLITDTDYLGYIDPANYDFHLAADSEHIDAGESLGYDCLPDAPELYWGTAPDLGAVETK